MEKSSTTTEKGRFKFGENWKNFLTVFSERRLQDAQKSLKRFLDVQDLQNKSFLDIGSGSGLFSLAARQMGARVHSFDYDQASVDCTKRLKDTFFPGDPHWTIEQNSVLNEQYIESCGKFDICYSWGVLHHTGALWKALHNAGLTVKTGGLFYIAIYNDQGLISKIWRVIKKLYCSSTIGKTVMTALFFPLFFIFSFLSDSLRFANPLRRYSTATKKERGMSEIHDWRDWLGGYPYEPATPASIITFYENLGFKLLKVKPPPTGLGNNEFLFTKIT
jgi:2-polyprenyl-6-hydroxyphenyl methylase/3-demethylubiquinone-9 3-methyltransferase